MMGFTYNLSSTNPLLFNLGTKASQKHHTITHRNLYQNAYFYSSLLSDTLPKRRLSSKQKRRPLCLPSSGENRESRSYKNGRATETVLKLYTALKNKNLEELSEIIADECEYACKFISFYQFFHGKKQVLKLCSYLMRSVERNIEFVVQPTLHNGTSIGISWKLEWKETRVALVKGFSFYTCHVYQGKLVIRNEEMFMEPLLHIKPIRLKIMGFVLNALGKMGSKTAARVALILFFMAVWMLLS